MKVKDFNQDYEIDRKARAVKAKAKSATAEFAVAPPTVAGTPYSVETTFYLLDEASREVRQSNGFRRAGEHFVAFGLKICEMAKLHKIRDAALSDGQAFFNAEIEFLRAKIRQYEAEKQPENRGLKAVLTSR